jgi:1,4-alpha-glucan branching enzyme
MVYQFCVICPGADQVCLMGDFNAWSTTATPMRNTEEHVWQLAIELPDEGLRGGSGIGGSAAPTRFSYFVIDKRRGTGAAPFGGTYLLPGSWAAVARMPAEETAAVAAGAPSTPLPPHSCN